MQDYESKYSGKEIDAILDDVANKVDKVEGKGLSSEDFTFAEKRKLEGLENYDDADLRKDLLTIHDSVVEVRENLDGVTELVNDFNADIGTLYETKQNAIVDLDAIRSGAKKGATSAQGVVVNRMQIAPDSEGNIRLPQILEERDITNMGFTKNKGTVTGVMVNGESKSPNSDGIVDLGEIKVDEVKFANDLTGVVEATPEMFTYRPSAGNKSVRDESAVIRRIKGNTSVWGQGEGLVKITTNKGVTITHESDGVIILSGEPTSDSVQVGYLKNNIGHIYLCVTEVLSMGGATSFVAGNLNLTYNKFTNVGSSAEIKVATVNFPNTYIGVYSVVGLYDGIKFRYQQFDLTDIFGAGEEPTTYEEFRQCYPDAYYPYCEPEVRSMRATGIETVGLNQWDEQWENGTFNTETGENISNNQIRCKNLIRIFPNTYYSLSIGDKNLGIWAMFYDENLNILQPVNLNSSVSRKCLYISPSGDRNVFLTPENASWMKFHIPAEYGSTTYKGDICINLSHSGVRNGEYKPYEKNTLLLPEIAKYFPNGMHGIGDVYDEINEEMAIQRCDVRAYEEGDENNAEVKTDKITTVYKLSEPIYTPIEEILQLDYKVDDFGTEKMLSNAPSAPFKADIVYQFNAEGRIRDNSRNIERLENKIRDIANVTTGVALQRMVLDSTVTSLLPNVVYEGDRSYPNIEIPPLQAEKVNMRNVWKVFVKVQDGNINFPFNVKWKDGVAPTYSDYQYVELTFFDNILSEICGEWKVYK